MNRKQFLKSVGLAGVGVLIPTIALADDKEVKTDIDLSDIVTEDGEIHLFSVLELFEKFIGKPNDPHHYIMMLGVARIWEGQNSGKYNMFITADPADCILNEITVQVLHIADKPEHVEYTDTYKINKDGSKYIDLSKDILEVCDGKIRN